LRERSAIAAVRIKENAEPRRLHEKNRNNLCVVFNQRNELQLGVTKEKNEGV